MVKDHEDDQQRRMSGRLIVSPSLGHAEVSVSARRNSDDYQ